eukprot:s855_g4.t1
MLRSVAPDHALQCRSMIPTSRRRRDGQMLDWGTWRSCPAGDFQSLEEDLQQLCSDTSLQRLQADLWQTYEACEANDTPAPFKPSSSGFLDTFARAAASLDKMSLTRLQAVVDSILEALDADKVDISKLQSVDCLEGLINALAASSRPLLHTSRGQWAAWASFTLASFGCWPLHGLGQAVPGGRGSHFTASANEAP